MAIPSSTEELRQFLDQCVNATTPLTYTDRAGHDHQVFLTKVDEVAVRTRSGRDEAALALTLIETTPETQEGGATGARAQEIFLLQCVDATTPIEYHDRLGRRHRVFLTRMTLQKRVAKKSPSEWQYQLTMVDAWGGVWIAQATALKVTTSVTITTRDRQRPKWGPSASGGKWNFNVWG